MFKSSSSPISINHPPFLNISNEPSFNYFNFLKTLENLFTHLLIFCLILLQLQNIKTSTSDDALKSYAIAGATSLLTMGIASGVEYLANSGSVANGANAANTVNGVNVTSNVGTNLASNSQTLTNQIITALKESAISNLSSTVAQSAINGESFSDSLKNAGRNVLIGAFTNVGAKQIGQLSHEKYVVDQNNNVIGVIPRTIDKPVQYLLHGALGCAGAAAGGGDCASGAMSGMVGEFAGERFKDAGFDRRTGSQLAGLVGGYSAIFTGNATGLDDKEVANNIFSGQRIGGNAALNNAFYIGGVVKIPYSDLLTGEGNDYDIHSGVKADLVTNSYSAGTDGKNNNLTFLSLGAGGYISITPHNSNTLMGASYNAVPGILFLDAMQTDLGMGFGLTLGAFLTPPIKAGVTIKPPEQK